MVRIGTVLNCINFIILKRKSAVTITPTTLPTTSFRTNNLAENPPLLTDTQLIVVVLISAMSSTPVLLLKNAKNIDTLILVCVPFQLTMGVIVPSLIYFYNPNLREFIWAELIPETIKVLHQKVNRRRSTKIEESIEIKVPSIELVGKKVDFTSEIVQYCQPSTSSVETCGCRLRLHLMNAAENDVSIFQL